jgi:CMP-N-acetylneuraminic acid synthetase
MRPNLILILSGCLILAALSGCADLKEINVFALTSHQVMVNNKYISYGYYEFARDTSYIYHPYPGQLLDVDCNCEAQKIRDTFTSDQCQVMVNYFAKLAVFTDPGSAIDAMPVGNALTAGAYGSFAVTREEVTVMNAAATAVSDLFTSGYKEKKMKLFITKYHDSVAPLISYLKIRSAIFGAMLVNMKDFLTKEADSLLTITNKREVKWPILISYEMQKKEIDREIDLYKKREQDFETIIEAGDLIYHNQEDLRNKDFIFKLKTLVNDLSLNAHPK